jgi:DNA-directed RNA polymerase subunit E'
VYRVYSISDSVRLPPDMFILKREDAIKQILREKYERKMDSDLGIILSINNVEDISGGYVVTGDGAAYYDAKFDVLTYMPEVNEIIESEVTEIVEFGAFLTLGPLEGLVHLSQITDDIVKLDRISNVLSGRNTKRMLKKGDTVKARIFTTSMKNTLMETKIGLSMRTPGLGKAEWKEKEKKTKTTEKKTKK